MVNSHHVIASSVEGYAHKINALPNQDAYSVYEEGNIKLVLVADGHGSKTCFRSQWGSRFAVEEGQRLIIDEMRSQKLDKLHDSQKLFKVLIKRWAIRILKHLKSEPFHEAEIKRLSAYQRKTIGKNALIAYGSTLSIALIFREHLYLWKIGDGSIIVRENEKDSVVEVLDRKWFGVETHSLSTCNPSTDVDFLMISPVPDAILLCSDGYKNAFKSDQDYYKALVDFSNIYHQEKKGYIEEHIETWLSETSQLGSGDDITLILLLREDDSQ